MCAFKVGIANGNWSTPATWDEVSNTPTSHASTNITVTGTIYTAAFTAPAADAVCAATGVALALAGLGTAGTVTVTLQQNSAGWVDCAGCSAAVNIATLYAAVGATLNNWVYFRATTPFVFLVTTASYYRWKIVLTGGAGTTTAWADAAGTACAYWSTNVIATPAIPGSTDLVLIPGQNGTTVIKVSVDGSRTIGNATNTAACTQMRPATASLFWDVQVGYGGELNYDNTASATLTSKGSLAVGGGGTLRMDDKAGAAYAAAYVATLTFNPTTSGDFGIGIFDKSTVVLQGQPKTTTALWKTHPNVSWDGSHNGTTGKEAVTADVVNWAINDELCIAPTDVYNHTEYKFIKTIGTGNTMTLSDTAGGGESALSYTHTTDAWVLNLTRNVQINTNDATKGCYIYNLNTVSGNVKIDWVRVENVGSTVTTQKYGVTGASVSYTEFNYNVLYNLVGYGLMHAASQKVETFTGNIATFSQTGSYWGFGSNAPFYNKTYNYCFAINLRSAGYYGSSQSGSTYNHCYAIACNQSSTGGYGGFVGAWYGCYFDYCEAHLNRGYGVGFTDASSSVVYHTNCLYGTKGANTTYDIGLYSAYFMNQIVFINTSYTIIPSFSNGATGSQINFDTVNGTAMKHYDYTPTGIWQCTGPGLVDTTVRTAGNYAMMATPDATTGGSGLKKTFYILCRPSSQVVCYGFKKQVGPAFTVNLYLPGSVTPDATQTFGATTDAGFVNWLVSANYTGTLYKFAKVEIVVTGTSGTCYVADVYNGTEPLGALQAWNNGDIAPVMYPLLGDAGAVWSYVLSNGATGDSNMTGVKSTLGTAGAGLTALGDSRIANLDATVSSRLASASYTAPPSAATIASTVWASVVETGYSAVQTLKLLLALAVGKTTTVITGPTTATKTIKSPDGTKNRIVADIDKNDRTSVTTDVT